MGTSDPKVSVVMPVFNTERYVALAVESILGQTFGDFEFIIIDDGSTDGAKGILERYAARDSRIRLVSRANTGYSVALNEGLGLARGEFVARMDSDDVSYPERFEKQVELLEGRPEVVAVGGQVCLIDPDGDRIGPMPDRRIEHEVIDAFHLDARGGMITHPAAMIRRNAVLKVGGYRIAFEPAEDVDLWLRLGEVGRLTNLSTSVLEYRVHLQSVSHMRSSKQIQMMHIAANEARERRGLEPLEVRAEDCSDGTEADVVRSWVRNAYWSRCYRVARKHARTAVTIDPRSLKSWRLLVGSYLGAIGRPLYALLSREH